MSPTVGQPLGTEYKLLMASAGRVKPNEPVGQPRLGGWLLMIVGLPTVAWWIWAWSKADTLIGDHLAAHGPLPTSAMDRAALYADGTPAEQVLSSALDSIAGLYPWGRLPLVLGSVALASGWFLSGSATRARAVAALAASALLFGLPLAIYGDSIRVALDILE